MAQNLLNTTTNGYDFFLLLLRQSYTNLMVKSWATQFIPLFSTHKDIHKYVRAIKEYECQYGLSTCVFTDTEITTVFLEHLDHSCFNLIVSTMTTELRSSSSIPPAYIVPAFASNIDQSVDITISSKNLVVFYSATCTSNIQ